jgi:hypothetical protein
MKQIRALHTDRTLQTPALDRILRHHARHCTHWIFSSDRHCSCGRDDAILELDMMREASRAAMIMQGRNPKDGARTRTG